MTEGDSKRAERRHALRAPNAWLAAQCKLSRADGARKKEREPLLLVQVTLPGLGYYVLRLPTIPYNGAGILTRLSFAQ